MVTADDNLLSVVETSVDEGVLVIKTKENFSTSLGIRVEVTAPKLTSLTVKGVGSLQAEGLDAESLTVDLSGVGSLKASGKVKQLTAKPFGGRWSRSSRANRGFCHCIGVWRWGG